MTEDAISFIGATEQMGTHNEEHGATRFKQLCSLWSLQHMGINWSTLSWRK